MNEPARLNKSPQSFAANPITASPIAKPTPKRSSFTVVPAQIPLRSSLGVLRTAAPLVETAPLRQCKVCVIVPARNEAAAIGSTLVALANQIDFNGQRLDPTCYEVIVFANNCTDETAAIANRFSQQHPDFVQHVAERTLPPEEAYIGRVRQLLMDEAHCRLSELGSRVGIIASTDADTQVSPTWISAIMYEIEKGADAVGGRILTHQGDRDQLDNYARACFLREVGYRSLIAELESYLDPEPHDPFPRHYQHYGASLAVTAEMYAKSGGMPPVRTPEDVAFYQALLRVDARFRHSPLVRVSTSARQTGRAEVGLAKQLQAWEKMGQQQQPFLVEPAIAIITRLQARRKLRALWRYIQRSIHSSSLNYHFTILNNTSHELVSLATLLDVSVPWLAQEISQASSFGRLRDRLEPQINRILAQRWALVPIEQANDRLRLYRQQYCKRSPALSLNRAHPNLVHPSLAYPSLAYPSLAYPSSAL
jgi:Glycosyl transferase family 2